MRYDIPRDKGETSIQFRATSYQELLTGPVRPVLYALFGALALVLLIACANVSNLLIARCLGRQQEFAVRTALGGSKIRLMWQMLAEGFALSLLGCGAGLLLAQVGMIGIRKLPAGTIPRADGDLDPLDDRIRTGASSHRLTVLSSLLPTFIVVRTNPQAALKLAPVVLGASSVSRKLSGRLVAAEVALSTLLLVGTGLLFHTLWNLERSRLGFESAQHHDVLGHAREIQQRLFGMAVSEDMKNAPAFYGNADLSADARPNSEGAREWRVRRWVAHYHFREWDMGSSFEIVGQPKDPEHESAHARVSAVSGDYARTLGTPVVRGRMIDETT